MGKTEKIGGIGKSPAIDKVNRIHENRYVVSKVEKLKKEVFEKNSKEMQKMHSIIDQYHISYSEEEKAEGKI